MLEHGAGKKFGMLAHPALGIEYTPGAGADLAARVFGEIRIRESGIHRLTLWIPGSQEKLEKTLTASAPDLEFEDPRRNDELLNTLAEKTEGQRFEPKNLASLADIIPDRSDVEIVSGIPITLWDRTWVMFTVVALLCLEWIIRKRYHLA